MLKSSVFATHITSLTDARYFAAMGVEYIGFELAGVQSNQVDIEFIKQIKEWLEGPAIIGCVRGDEDLNQLTKWVVDGQLDGLFFYGTPGNSVLEAFTTQQIFVAVENLTEANKLPANSNWVLKESIFFHWWDKKEKALKEKLQQSRLFLDGDFSDTFFKSEVFQHEPGLVLKGSEEEKVGFKSFDDLDRIFAYLMEA
jgi:phosphoribosylanthranilate isomerase